jgi:predicted nuclease of predicted toxin-antitoxin system
VRLLFDHNLSPRLTDRLADTYPDSEHVRGAGLAAASDAAVWEYAKRHALTIVSKDSDFHQRSLLEGFPPKVVWIRRGNCSTADIEALLRARSAELRAFDADPWGAFLVLE